MKRVMNKKRQKQIEEIAASLLEHLGLYPESVEELISQNGIDIKRVVGLMDVHLSEYDFGDDVSGVLLTDGRNAKIGYAKSNGSLRQRFTIAHELGHLQLKHQRQGVFVDTPEKYYTFFRDSKSSTGEDVQEREANAFAAAILMPRDLVIQAANEIYRSGITRKEDFDIVEQLAEQFNVSKLAMSIRLTNLDLQW